MNTTKTPASLAAVRAELSRDPEGGGCKCTFALNELVMDHEQRTIACPHCGTHLPPFDVALWLSVELDGLLESLDDEAEDV